jgi:hypothetical protein
MDDRDRERCHSSSQHGADAPCETVHAVWVGGAVMMQMPVPTKLDLYLAGFLPNSRQGHERLYRAGITFADARKVVDQIQQTPFGDYVNRIWMDMVISTFGTPDRVEPDRFFYDSVLSPEHVYRYLITQGDYIGGVGFVARSPRERPATLTEDAGSLRRELLMGLDTEDDIRRWFGPPSSDDGWWPFSWLTYGHEANDDAVTVHFEHCILSAITDG